MNTKVEVMSVVLVGTSADPEIIVQPGQASRWGWVRPELGDNIFERRICACFCSAMQECYRTLGAGWREVAGKRYFPFWVVTVVYHAMPGRRRCVPEGFLLFLLFPSEGGQ